MAAADPGVQAPHTRDFSFFFFGLECLSGSFSVSYQTAVCNSCGLSGFFLLVLETEVPKPMNK